MWRHEREDGRGGQVIILMRSRVKIMKVEYTQGTAKVVGVKLRRKMVTTSR